GGDIHQRMTFLERIYNRIREQIDSVPIALKMNCDDFVDGGLTINESMIVAERMTDLGIDLIEISGGGFDRDSSLKPRANHSDSKLAEVTYAGHAEKIRMWTRNLPLALVEGFKHRSVMDEIIERDIADIVSMSRPFIREPDLVKKLRNGQEDTSCTRCDACSSSEVFGKVMLECQLD
ncbi:MAG: hypothetical protein GF411_06180, partial [Candidatus Lokiarchaeota archaeon]|nr:hypothetical protein [Candidatus Lokiarchaeota archaeon]